MGKFSDDKAIISAVTASTSRNEALKLLGIRGSWWSYERLETACSRLNLRYAQKQILPARSVPDAEVFAVNSSFGNSGLIKKRLIAGGCLENKCYGEGCALTANWLGRPLSLQLDHINGIHNDNRIENLRFLCPNCHSQTETFSGRRSKKPNKLCACGKHIARISTECGACAQKRRRSTNRMSDSELLDLSKLTKEIGYSAAGRRFGLTGNAIKKRLHGANLLGPEIRTRTCFPASTMLCFTT